MFDNTGLVVGNAAGTARTIGDVDRLAKNAVTRITIGSITRYPRDGNNGDVYYFDHDTRDSVNALGLPNQGCDVLLTELRDMCTRTHAVGKELVVSVAGFSPPEYAEMAAAFAALGVDGIELNLGCPNVWAGGARKPIPSYEPVLVSRILGAVAEAAPDVHLGIKISPVEHDTLEQLTRVIRESGIVDEVVAVNTLPDAQLTRPDGGQALHYTTPGDGIVQHTGGLAGSGLYEHGLRTVSVLRPLLPTHIRIIAVGGILCGTRAHAHFSAGASGFEIATGYLEYGPRTFGEVCQELTQRWSTDVA